MALQVAGLLMASVENKVREVFIVCDVAWDEDKTMRERSGRNY